MCKTQKEDAVFLHLQTQLVNAHNRQLTHQITGLSDVNQNEAIQKRQIQLSSPFILMKKLRSIIKIANILFVKVNVMVNKVDPRTGQEGPEGEHRYSSTPSLTLVLEAGGWSMPHPSHFTPPAKDSVPIV